MPVIRIYGTPPSATEIELEKLIDAVRAAVSGIVELKLKPEQITVFIIDDRVKKGLGDEVIAFIDGLLPQPERTSLVKQSLREVCGKKLCEFFPKALVECFLGGICWSSNSPSAQKSLAEYNLSEKDWEILIAYDWKRSPVNYNYTSKEREAFVQFLEWRRSKNNAPVTRKPIWNFSNGELTPDRVSGFLSISELGFTFHNDSRSPVICPRQYYCIRKIR